MVEDTNQVEKGQAKRPPLLTSDHLQKETYSMITQLTHDLVIR